MSEGKKGRFASSHASPRADNSVKQAAKEDGKLRRVEELMQADVSLDEKLLEINSGRRTKKLAGAVLSESDSVLRLTDQLKVRDRYIEVLKSKLIDVCVESRGLEHESLAAKDRLVQSLLAEKAELIRQVQSTEALVTENQAELEQLRLGVSVEKGNLESRIEGLNGEVERLKGELEARNELGVGMKADLVQLSKIIQEMTTLNSELNEKVAGMNTDLERKTVEHYQAISKAQHIEDVEKNLAEQTEARNRLEEKLSKLTPEVSRLSELEETAKEAKRLIAKLPGSEEDHLIETIMGLLPRFEGGFVRPPGDAALLKDKVKQLEMEMRGKNHELTRSTTNEASLRTRLASQLADFDQWKRENTQTVERLANTVKTLKSGLASVEERASKQESDYVKVVGEGQKWVSRAAAMQAKVEKAMEASRKAIESEGKAQHALKEAQQQLLQLKLGRTTQDSALALREQKVKQDAARVKVMSEELWKKDTQLLKKSAEIMKLEDTLSTLRTSIQLQQTRSKLSAATDSALINRMLEERDREIAALKSLLRHPKTNKIESAYGSPKASSRGFEDLMGDLVKMYVSEGGVERRKGDFEGLVERLEAFFQTNKGRIAAAGLKQELRTVLGAGVEQAWSPSEFIALVRSLESS